MKFVARQSEHIQEDIQRNWSSWNFGKEGFEGSRLDLMEAIDKAIEKRGVFYISGFDVWPESKDYSSDNAIYVDDFEFRELYEGYWVAVDNINASGGLSCISLEADNLEDAIKESEDGSYYGDGESFDATEYDLVYSNEEIHIFKIKE